MNQNTVKVLILILSPHNSMGSDTFDTLRIVMVLVVGAVRLGLMPYYLQSYLNLAYEKIEAQKKESGRISNKDLQKKVSG